MKIWPESVASSALAESFSKDSFAISSADSLPFLFSADELDSGDAVDENPNLWNVPFRRAEMLENWFTGTCIHT